MHLREQKNRRHRPNGPFQQLQPLTTKWQDRQHHLQFPKNVFLSVASLSPKNYFPTSENNQADKRRREGEGGIKKVSLKHFIRMSVYHRLFFLTKKDGMEKTLEEAEKKLDIFSHSLSFTSINTIHIFHSLFLSIYIILFVFLKFWPFSLSLCFFLVFLMVILPHSFSFTFSYSFFNIFVFLRFLSISHSLSIHFPELREGGSVLAWLLGLHSVVVKRENLKPRREKVTERRMMMKRDEESVPSRKKSFFLVPEEIVGGEKMVGGIFR